MVLLELAVVCAALASAADLRPFRIEDVSMQPTLRAGQIVAVELATYQARPAERGDIVVFQLKTVRKPLVKRAVGLPGDRIEFREGLLYINERRVEEPYLPNGQSRYRYAETEEDRIMTPLRNRGSRRIPAGHLLLLGDNREFSQDSRRLGFIPASYIVGKVTGIVRSSPRSSDPQSDERQAGVPSAGLRE